jgi:hypothetical protein
MTRPAETTAAGLGVIAAAGSYVVVHHYLQTGWTISLPVPMLWWVLGWVAGVLGTPLLLVALGRRAERLTALSWPRLLAVWVVPVLVASVLWVFVTLRLLRRFNPGFAGLPAGDHGWLLPAPELSLLYAAALLPALAKVLRRVPAPAVIAALCALTLLSQAAVVLVFLYAGLTLPQAFDRLTAEVTGRDLAARAAVAIVGAAVLGVERFPPGLGMAVAGLAALPLGLGLAALTRSGALSAIGRAAVPTYLLIVPTLIVADAVLLPRLSTQGQAVQLVAALVEPVVLTAGLVIGGLILSQLGRLLRQRRALVEVPQ